MSYRDWPQAVGGNKFSLAKYDPETPPARMRVATWSNVFSGGGSVTIEGYTDKDERIGNGFGSIKIERNGSVREEREHLENLLEDFQEDLASNWYALITAARASTAAYYAKQAAEYAEKSAAAAQGVFE